MWLLFSWYKEVAPHYYYFIGPELPRLAFMATPISFKSPTSSCAKKVRGLHGNLLFLQIYKLLDSTFLSFPSLQCLVKRWLMSTYYDADTVLKSNTKRMMFTNWRAWEKSPRIVQKPNTANMYQNSVLRWRGKGTLAPLLHLGYTGRVLKGNV